MFWYALKRIGLSVPTAVLVTVIVFLMMRAIPGDPVMIILGDNTDAALEAEMRGALGIDQNWLQQYGHWMGRVLTGDLGRSVINQEPVLGLILSRFPVTAQVVLAATLLAMLIAVPAGVFAAWRQNTRSDYAIVTAAIVLVSVPSFWVGLMLIWVFSVKWAIFPTFGFESVAESGLSALKYLVLPVIAIVCTEIASITRMMRSTMIEVLRLEYITHAKAKGLSSGRVLFRHAFPNAFAPTLTLIGIILGNLLSGAAVIETVFTIPGIGRLLVDAIYARDYPVVQGCLIFIAFLYVIVNLVVDLLYTFFDPRIRY
jgi:peptide/nickel transport system permease protein